MDPRERIADPEEAFRVGVEGILAGLWTALPCTVAEVDLVKMTVQLQPTIMAKVRAPNGTLSDVRLPVLVDVPIIYQGGGGFTATFPIAVGDEALAVFSSRCIDSWWQSGGVQTQAEIRMHDLSDAFCFVGPRSQPHVIRNISTTSAQLRNNAGDTYVEVASGQIVNIVAPGGVTVTTPTMTVTGNVIVEENLTIAETITVQNVGGAGTTSTINGTLRTISGDIIADTVSLKTHVHTGVTTGLSNTGEPVP